MPVITVNVGPKRVALTAYCPDDVVGLAACDYVLNKVRDLVGDGVPEDEFWDYLFEKHERWKLLKDMLDNGWELDKEPPLAMDPRNKREEMRIINYLAHEQKMQRKNV